jgi:hypothetical protein
MFKYAWERLALRLDRQLLAVSFALTVGGVLLGCLEVMTLNVSSGIVGGIIALSGLGGMIASLPFHRGEGGEPPHPLFEE